MHRNLRTGQWCSQDAYAEETATATRRIVEIGMSKERARLRVEFEQPSVRPVNVIVGKIINDGLTPAFITGVALECSLASLGEPWMHLRNIEPLGAGERISQNVSIACKLTEDAWEAIWRGADYLLAHAKIEYSDVFDVPHETSTKFALGSYIMDWVSPSKRVYYWYRYSDDADEKRT